uniref:NTPase n=1 Tax=Poxviridae sp. TaxID=2717630 RepID=A0A6G8HIZ0_9POXV|nr:NTPase [Poxviridae sp.]
MATCVINDIIFALKQINVPSLRRQEEDPKFVEAFTCDELEEYIKRHPDCTLFETLRNEEECSIVRLFLDIDLDYPTEETMFINLLKDLITTYTKFITTFVEKNCKETSPDKVRKHMLSNFSVTVSTNPSKTSSHIIFPNVYTTIETLIFMKRSLLELIKTSKNPLIKSIDPAIYRKGTTLRILGTRKSKDSIHVHVKKDPKIKFSDHLFTFINMNEKTCYFTVNTSVDEESQQSMWCPNFISFDDTIRLLKKIIVNDIVNINDITEDTFISTPLIIDYASPCALCKKKYHKHPHQLGLRNDALRIFKSGNPYSCKVKTISLEGNKLFTIAQYIYNSDVIKLTDRGDYIVWINNAWRFSDESLITKLVLSMRNSIPSEYSIDLLCPRKRKIIENNLRDMLVDAVETDFYYDKIPFTNGVLDLNSDILFTGNEAKQFMCTASTGYDLKEENKKPSIIKDALSMLYSIIDDIQPKTAENAKNRELYERVLSSSLCGTTKQCLVFFYGDTATGKTTTKKLLKSVLGNLFIETGQSILTEPMDKGPNPFVASMHLKRVVFCSELPDFACNGAKKIRSDNIKKLTETCIVGRLCFSNKINNRNHATIIIDTNYRPVFDRVDNALMRRIALVKFRTHFSTLAGQAAAKNNSAYDKVKLLDESLETKIQQNYFRYAFLQILCEWYKTYHSPIMRLDANPDEIPDFTFQLKVNSLIVASSPMHLSKVDHFAKLGYSVLDGEIGLIVSVFSQRLSNFFNLKTHGHDIESFINRNKKFNSLGEEYISFIFIEDIPHK